MKTKSVVTAGTSRRGVIAIVFRLPVAVLGLLATTMQAGAERSKLMMGGSKAKWTAPVLRQIWQDGRTTVVA
jgi:hypothetical protein